VVESSRDFMLMFERFPRELTARQRRAQKLQRNFDTPASRRERATLPMAASTELFEQRVAASSSGRLGVGRAASMA